MSNNNQVSKEAPIGLVMISRFLWTYAEAYRMTERKEYLDFARHMRDFLLSHLMDTKFGGFYWLADRSAEPLDRKKVLYGQTFALYG